MIQLTIQNGSQIGRSHLATRFPLEIGRAPDADFRLEADGVWDQHAVLDFKPDVGFVIEHCPGALLSVNGQRLEQARLRNGDSIECGSVKLRFWLAPVVQSSLLLREAMIWLALLALCLFQFGLLRRWLD